MKIKWEIDLIEQEYEENLENIKLKDCDYGFGGFLSDFLLVHSIIINRNSFNTNNKAEEIRSYQEFYGKISKVCYLLYVSSYYCIRQSKGHIYKKNEKEINKHSIDEIIADFKTVNKLLNDSILSINHSKISELNKLLEHYSNMSSLINDYKNKEKRCVAAYLFFKKQNDIEGYIAFSGFVDCCKSVLKSIDPKVKEKTNFIKYLNEIAKALSLKLITTNLEIKKYSVDYSKTTRVRVNTRLLDEVGKKAPNELKKEYSCCERKIFTEFETSFYDGTLYVKFPPCEKCQLGILYEHQEKHYFEVVPNLYI
ncbi:MAG: hypothetical protein IJC80_00975 [Clostridia bacterium]|nr:hypothetical protein [Clostridia bacterium]